MKHLRGGILLRSKQALLKIIAKKESELRELNATADLKHSNFCYLKYSTKLGEPSQKWHNDLKKLHRRINARSQTLVKLKEDLVNLD